MAQRVVENLTLEKLDFFIAWSESPSDYELQKYVRSILSLSLRNTQHALRFPLHRPKFCLYCVSVCVKNEGIEKRETTGATERLVYPNSRC